MWWVNFGRGSELVGAAIIEAPTIYHARMQLALRGIGRTADYSEGKEVDAERAALIPRDLIGRLLLPDEAQKIRLLSIETGRGLAGRNLDGAIMRPELGYPFSSPLPKAHRRGPATGCRQQ
jgi:hypothetical protein